MLGWLLAQSLGVLSRRVREVEELRDRERAEAERALARLRRELEEAEQRAKEQSEVFLLLPDLVRQMFSAPGRRSVGPLALKLMDQLFRPDQAAIFHARPSQRRLALSVSHGLPSPFHPGYEIEYGQGRVGHVAESRVAMDDSDFRTTPAAVRLRTEGASARDLRVDAAAPIEDETGLVGVLCVSGARLRQGEEKRLLKMVADLTAVALKHVTQLHAVEEMANMDGLTKLYNKRWLTKRLGDEIHRAERELVPLSILILDIDHFKHYNDRNGHLQGDEVLKKAGQLLRGAIREEDVAARYGGEEFVILYPGAPKDVAARLAESLRQAFEAFPFPEREHQPTGAVTISGGVATFPEDGRSAVDLMRAADQALYEAKAAGRNRITAARPQYLT